jgi:deoxyribodipyrimidine photolyase-related protein
MPIRNLILIFGDQLDASSAAFDGFDPAQDAVSMQEVREEATYVPQHKIRLVLFFSAMRHFRDDLIAKGIQVHYRKIDDDRNSHNFADEIAARVRQLRPQKLIILEPGDYRVRQKVERTARQVTLPLEIREDRHFFLLRRRVRVLLTGQAPGTRELLPQAAREARDPDAA